jgi:hypothetical protein
MLVRPPVLLGVEVAMTTCSCGSGKPVVAWGRCGTCYRRAYRAGELPTRAKAPKRCAVCRATPTLARGLCKRCYNRVSTRIRRGNNRRVVAT